MRSTSPRSISPTIPAPLRRGRVRTRGGWSGGWWAAVRVRPRGGAGGRRDAGALAPTTARGRLGGGFPALRLPPVEDARNPALSARLPVAMRSTSLRSISPTIPAPLRRGRVRTRGGRSGGWWAAVRVRPRGGAGGRRDAGALAPTTARGRLGGGFPALRLPPVEDARNPALSANSIASIGSWSRRHSRRGKQGARVPRDGAPRTSSGPEGSSDKGNATGAAVPPGSLLRHVGMRQGTGPRAQGTGLKLGGPGSYRARGMSSQLPTPGVRSALQPRGIAAGGTCALCPAPYALSGGVA